MHEGNWRLIYEVRAIWIELWNWKSTGSLFFCLHLRYKFRIEFLGSYTDLLLSTYSLSTRYCRTKFEARLYSSFVVYLSKGALFEL